MGRYDSVRDAITSLRDVYHDPDLALSEDDKWSLSDAIGTLEGIEPQD